MPSLSTEELQITSDRLIKSMHYIHHLNYIFRQVSYPYNLNTQLVKVIDLAVIIVKPMVFRVSALEKTYTLLKSFSKVRGSFFSK